MSKNQKIKMRLRSYNHRALDRGVHEIIGIAQKTGASVRGPIPLPREIHKFTILRSPHIDKKSQDQYERRTYSRLLELLCTSKTLDALTDLIMPSEIEVEIKI